MIAETAGVFNDWLNNEINCVAGHLLYALLNDMIAILVVDAVKYSIL